MNRRQFLQLTAAAAAAGTVSAQQESKRPLVGTVLPGDPEAFAGAGFDYFEMSLSRWLDPRLDDAAFEMKLAELAKLPLPCLAWNGFLPGEVFPAVGLEADIDGILAWGKTAFDRVKLAGGKVVTFGSGAARSRPEGFPEETANEQLAALLGDLAGLAEAAGVVFAVENLNRKETNLGVSLAECLALAEASAAPSLRLTADVYHMLVEAEGPEILAKAAPRIAHCHIAEKLNRSQPGISGDDFRPYLDPLFAAGYDGMITFECTWQGNPAEVAAPALEAFRRQLAACGT
jgi:sugar phosphate isomerase/epimerase